MLALVQINLLPLEYRVQARTPLGPVLATALGLLSVAAIGLYGIDLRSQLATETARHVALTAECERLRSEVENVEKLKRELDAARRRQDAIIAISQSKIVWSQKLIQFGRIMASYPDFWIDRLSLAKGGAGGGTLTFGIHAVGGDLRNLAQFRQSLTRDTNFQYHFDPIEAPRTLVDKGGGLLAAFHYTGPVTDSACTLPLR